MIGFTPKDPQAQHMERGAASLHALTNVPLDMCMRIVCEIDDVPTVAALIEVVKSGIKAQQVLLIYQAVSELEMLR